MKAFFIGLIILIGTGTSLLSAQDSIYVMQYGRIKQRLSLSDIDSVSFFNSLDRRTSVLAQIARESRFSIFYNALKSTGLIDSLRSDKDRTYQFSDNDQNRLIKKAQGDWFYQEYPAARFYGFTVFLESDSTFQQYGIQNLTDLIAYAKRIYDAVYPEDANVVDLSDRRNSLNRFVAYHLINKRLSSKMLIDAFDTDHMVKTVDMTEYLETMCPNTLLEISKIRSTGKTNQLNRSISTGKATQILASSENDPKLNGLYHEIDKPLIFSSDLQQELSAKRLRFDFASLLPELTNNGIRGRGTTSPNLQYRIPANYLKNLSLAQPADVVFLTPYYKYQDYQGDELYVASLYNIPFDFSITLPPIPAGTYEVRYGYLTNGKRGVIHLFLDNQTLEEPINLNIASTSMDIGYVQPGTDPSDPNGFENDKTLRNHGFMKAPACFKVPTPGWSFGENARMSPQLLRKIVGTFSFNTFAKHLLTVKGLSLGEFQLDYIEFVPVSLLETEDIF